VPEQDYLVSKFGFRRKKSGTKRRSAKDWEGEAHRNAIEVRRQQTRADSAMRVLNRQKSTPFLSTLGGKATVAGAALAGGAATVGGIGLYNRSKRKAAEMGLSEPMGKADLRVLRRMASNTRRTNGRFGYNASVKKALGIPGLVKPRVSAGFRTQRGPGMAKPPKVPMAGRLAPTGNKIGGTPGPTAPRIPKPAIPKVR
jgi:hypothetical protein